VGLWAALCSFLSGGAGETRPLCPRLHAMLIWRFYSLLAIIGAVVIIAIQAVRPFFQQTIHCSCYKVNAAEATISAAIYYENGHSPDLDLATKAAIQNGILNIESNTTAFDVTPQWLYRKLHLSSS
jgi:hypothetical protein